MNLLQIIVQEADMGNQSNVACHNHLLSLSLLWWDYLEGGSKSKGGCLNFDQYFQDSKI